MKKNKIGIAEIALGIGACIALMSFKKEVKTEVISVTKKKVPVLEVGDLESLGKEDAKKKGSAFSTTDPVSDKDAIINALRNVGNTGGTTKDEDCDCNEKKNSEIVEVEVQKLFYNTDFGTLPASVPVGSVTPVAGGSAVHSSGLTEPNHDAGSALGGVEP